MICDGLRLRGSLRSTRSLCNCSTRLTGWLLALVATALAVWCGARDCATYADIRSFAPTDGDVTLDLTHLSSTSIFTRSLKHGAAPRFSHIFGSSASQATRLSLPQGIRDPQVASFGQCDSFSATSFLHGPLHVFAHTPHRLHPPVPPQMSHEDPPSGRSLESGGLTSLDQATLRLCTQALAEDTVWLSGSAPKRRFHRLDQKLVPDRL